MWLVSLVLFLLFLYLFDKYFIKDDDFDKIPGPKGIPLFENALDFLADRTQVFYYFRDWANKFKDGYKIKLGPKKFIFIITPEDAETLISSTKYNNKGFAYEFLKPWLREGLLISKGGKWHQRRKILTPAFHFNILHRFKTVLEENSRRFAAQLEQETEKDKTDVMINISDFTLHSICETAMGTKLDEQSQEFGRLYKKAISDLGNYVLHRLQRIWLYPSFSFYLSPTGKKQKIILNQIASFRDSVIKKRKETINFKILEDTTKEIEDVLPNKKRLAMLDLLLKAEKDEIINDDGIKEEVDTFMFEGHDTTATALQFTFMLMANHPKIQEKIFEECRSIIGDRTATMAELSSLKYTECCIKESMRLYPPVYFVTRSAEHPIKFKDFEVPAGTDCTLFIIDVQRRSDQFPDPLAFKPERFLVEPTWHPYAYIPFSAGPRNCIGQKFAMIEMKLAISTVIQKYRLLPVTKPEDIKIISDMLLRPRDPIYVKFEKRL